MLPDACAAENSNKCCQPQNRQEAVKPAANSALKGRPTETSGEQHSSTLSTSPGVRAGMSSVAKASTQTSLSPLTPCWPAQTRAAAQGTARLTQLVMLHNLIASFLSGRRGCLRCSILHIGTQRLGDGDRIRASGEAGGTPDCPPRVAEDLRLR